MEEIEIVNKFMNEREFRNYIHTMFYKHNYSRLKIDDVRLSDDIKENDNDLIVTKNKIKYTVQTYLNTTIGDKQIEETIKDMEKEKLSHGIIVTNYYVEEDMKNKASKKNITILDRSKFKEGIYK